MTLAALLSASALVAVAIAISRYHALDLEKDILVGIVRASVQLTVVGYLLNYIFGRDDWRFTLGIIGVMIINAGVNAAKRGKGIPHILFIVTGGITIGSLTTLLVLVAVKVVAFTPREAIPISGMIVGNAMVASGLTLSRLQEELRQRRTELLTALTLGASSRQAVAQILRIGIRTGMLPTIDSLKTLGIVQLPGMMTGLILAGASPLQAIRYQLLVMFMLSSATAITCTTVSLLVYRQFFTPNHQLLEELL